ESGRRGGPRVPAHEKVAGASDEWRSLRGSLGEDFVKEVFALIFRLNAKYVKSAYTTDTYIKIGEVAYLLTAAAGWNPKGLELEPSAPSSDPDAEDTNVDLDAAEAPTPKGRAPRSAPTGRPPPKSGLVGKRNVSFDEDSDERPKAGGFKKGPAKRASRD